MSKSKKPTPISRGRIKKSAQVHMDDHQIVNSALLASLKDRERKRQAFLNARDAYLKQNTAAKEAVIALKPPKGTRLRCGEFVLRVKDEVAKDRKARTSGGTKVKIDLAA